MPKKKQRNIEHQCISFTPVSGRRLEGMTQPYGYSSAYHQIPTLKIFSNRERRDIFANKYQTCKDCVEKLLTKHSKIIKREDTNKIESFIELTSLTEIDKRVTSLHTNFYCFCNNKLDINSMAPEYIEKIMRNFFRKK